MPLYGYYSLPVGTGTAGSKSEQQTERQKLAAKASSISGQQKEQLSVQQSEHQTRAAQANCKPSSNSDQQKQAAKAAAN
jgi:hypothetical protein